MSNVISEIVNTNLCSGCGVCAAACPKGNLEIREQQNGDIAPVDLGNCTEGCSVCLKVCPFSNDGPNETDIAEQRFKDQISKNELNFNEITGYVRNSYAAYSTKKGQREAGASGGMATWMLEKLLREGLVDKVICLVPSSSASLFEFQIFEDIKDIQSGSGSHYYPVSVDKVLSKVMSDSSTCSYAIIGLPCVLKGISKAQAILPKLRKIKYFLGLTCGHMPNRFYTQYACSLSGIDPEKVTGVKYREKEGASSAKGHCFRAFSAEKAGQKVFFREKMATPWINNHFQISACNYCDDVFSEVADLCVMDAWLPQYSHDPRGHSLLLFRNENLEELLNLGSTNGECEATLIPATELIQSQESLVSEKKHKIAGRLYKAESSNVYIKKRIDADRKVYLENCVEFFLKEKLQERSKMAWAGAKENKVKNYRSQVRFADCLMECCHFCQRIKRVVRNPHRVYRKILSTLGVCKSSSRSEKGTHMSKKILILDAFSAAHVGNGVLLQSSLKLVNKIWPDAQVDVLAQKMDTLKSITDEKYSRSLFYDYPSGKTKLQSLVWVAQAAVFIAVQMLNAMTLKVAPSKFCIDKHRRRAMEAIESCDVAISITGEAINDSFKKALPFYLFTYWIASRLGKKVILFPQSIGPLKLTWTRWLVAKVLKKCEFIAARDNFAVQELESLGLEEDKFAFSPDVGVLQPYWDKKRAEGALQRLGVNRNDGALIGVCVSKLQFRESGIDQTDFRDLLVDTLKEIAAEEKIQVILMPTNMPFDGLVPRDYESCLYVQEKLADTCPVHILDKRVYDPREYKAITSVLDLFITTRMHACIMATMANTPTIAISTQRKIEGYMENIGQENFVVSHAISASQLGELITQAFTKVERIRLELSESKVKMRSLIDGVWIQSVNNMN